MYVDHFATVGRVKNHRNLPAGWWMLPAIAIGSGIWAALAYAILT